MQRNNEDNEWRGQKDEDEKEKMKFIKTLLILYISIVSRLDCMHKQWNEEEEKSANSKQGEWEITKEILNSDSYKLQS